MTVVKENAQEETSVNTVADDLFPKFPTPLLQNSLFGYLGPYERASLADHDQFSSFPEYQPYKGRAQAIAEDVESDLRQFLWLVARGKQTEAQALLSQNCELLVMQGQTTDYSYRTIEIMAFELALAVDDIEMCRMMLPYFDRLPKGRALAFTLYQERMKQKEKMAAEQPAGVEALNKVFKVIQESKCAEDCELALEEFRQAVTVQGVISNGNIFDIRLLILAFDLTCIKFKDLVGDFDDYQNKLVWLQVIGYLQRLLPACYAQALCTGLEYIVKYGGKLDRSLKFQRDEEGRCFFPLDEEPKFRLGYEYLCRAASWSDQPGMERTARVTRDALVALVRKKEDDFIELGRELEASVGYSPVESVSFLSLSA